MEIKHFIIGTQITFANTADEAWEAFIEAPSQDFQLQIDLIRWAQVHNDFSVAASLWQECLSYQNILAYETLLSHYYSEVIRDRNSSQI